jgi:hypothetical protein
VTTVLQVLTWIALGAGAVILALFMFARRR